HEPMDLGLADREELGSCTRLHRGRAWGIINKRHLTEMPTGSELRDVHSVALDDEAAIDDDEHLAPWLPLLHDRASGLVRAWLRQREDFHLLAVVEVLKERKLGNGLDARQHLGVRLHRLRPFELRKAARNENGADVVLTTQGVRVIDELLHVG